MKRQWRTAATVAVPPALQGFHSLEAWKWDRLALYLDTGRQVPECFDDEAIDDAINQLWETRHWLLR